MAPYSPRLLRSLVCQGAQDVGVGGVFCLPLLLECQLKTSLSAQISLVGLSIRGEGPIWLPEDVLTEVHLDAIVG